MQNNKSFWSGRSLAILLPKRCVGFCSIWHVNGRNHRTVSPHQMNSSHVHKIVFKSDEEVTGGISFTLGSCARLFYDPRKNVVQAVNTLWGPAQTCRFCCLFMLATVFPEAKCYAFQEQSTIFLTSKSNSHYFYCPFELGFDSLTWIWFTQFTES